MNIIYQFILFVNQNEEVKIIVDNIKQIEERVKISAGIISNGKLAKYFENAKSYSLLSVWFILVIGLIGAIVFSSLSYEIIYFSANKSIANFFDDKSLACFDYTIQNINCIEHHIIRDLYDAMNVYKYAFSRITFISSLFIGLFFCIKNFNINKHNNITYQYKAIIMKTLPAIFTNFPDSNKEIYFEKLADFLFKHHDTGMNKNTDPGMPNDKVIDLLSKTLGKNKEAG